MKYNLSTMADIGGDENGIQFIQRTAPVAAKYGIGLELSEFCISENLDEHFEEIHREILKKIEMAPAVILHGPYNELYPSAIDTRAVEFAKFRYGQAFEKMQLYGIKKMVIHSGYIPLVYHKEWFVQRSVDFWKEFLEKHPGDYVLCLENVMEDEPELLCELVDKVKDERVRLCLDVGHANVVSKRPPLEWAKTCAPWLSHFHIHNNQGQWDTHNALDDGVIDMKTLLQSLETLCPKATCTVESMEAEASAKWLWDNGFLKNRG